MPFVIPSAYGNTAYGNTAYGNTAYGNTAYGNTVPGSAPVITITCREGEESDAEPTTAPEPVITSV